VLILVLVQFHLLFDFLFRRGTLLPAECECLIVRVTAKKMHFGRETAEVDVVGRPALMIMRDVQ
jgi:hypothetical protein